MDERWIEMLRSFVLACYEGIFIYLVLAIMMCSVLVVAAARTLIRRRDLDPLHYHEMLDKELAPAVSLLVPVRNNEDTIIHRIAILLDIQYAIYEVIIINDGSEDGTMRCLKETYDLMPIQSKVHYSGLGQETGQIQRIYQSRLHDRLIVIDKAYGGRMDSLNVGLNISQYPYIASVGPHTILERDALMKIMKPVMDALPGEEVVACSGRVDLTAPNHTNHKNSADSTDHRTERMGRTLYVMQTIEYVRAFLISGVGLVRYNINVLLFTSEVFGVFKKNRVMEVGGYKRHHQAAHMELVMRLQKHMKQIRERGRIIYIPDPICRVEIPGTWRQLCRQRIGWHSQLASSLWAQRGMIFNPAYGWMGMVSIPYFIFIELLGPVLELGAILLFIAGIGLQLVDMNLCIILALLLTLYGSLLSAGAVMLEAWCSRKSHTSREVTHLLVYACSETFWFRPLNNLSRIYGMLQAMGLRKEEEKNSSNGLG
ncbi:glycosyltransferase family 2 protein [Paenibacillus xylanexedens]|uniref:glycosyltransferase family 2 protein n=1 Tax=Paenibacillus xylanexedens TaxID=528191 RepID=UPI0011A95108|nr:glycosyltransferase family 2 protein [Paenibacillus xylanexedens]